MAQTLMYAYNKSQNKINKRQMNILEEILGDIW